MGSLAEPGRTTTDAPLDGGIFAFIARHWLFGVNALTAIYAALPLAAPALKAVGLHLPAQAIYFVYMNFFCHQILSRHFYIGDYPIAYCQRDLAIYTSMFLGGLAFALVRDRLRPLPWTVYGILILPMAVDGFTQLFGWRESTWALRVLTGTLFGLASVWLLYPRLGQLLRSVWDFDISR